MITTPHCRVMKLADMPSCLGGGEFGINVAYGLTTKFSFCSMANRSVGGSNPLPTALHSKSLSIEQDQYSNSFLFGYFIIRAYLLFGFWDLYFSLILCVKILRNNYNYFFCSVVKSDLEMF
jgi:hypothetical protein